LGKFPYSEGFGHDQNAFLKGIFLKFGKSVKSLLPQPSLIRGKPSKFLILPSDLSKIGGVFEDP
jgi:hypothetical protein